MSEEIDSSKEIFRTPKGMRDILPKEGNSFYRIENACRREARNYNFQKIDFPILENVDLFKKGTGLYTDIVEKQMYSLRTKGNERLALRPEGTPSVVRAYFQRGMKAWPQPVKLWYMGPFFRHENPQAGRYRQFHQFGFEVLNDGAAVIDAQVIQLFFNLLEGLHLKDLVVEINSIGYPEERAVYRTALTKYLKRHFSQLCSDCQRRIRTNPLRILDCKQLSCQRIIAGAPQIIDYLSNECNNHFKEVLELLEELKIPYDLNPYLVRGLDYYTRTVFEIAVVQNKKQGDDNSKEGKELRQALVGGGRYDRLSRLIGGSDIPAVGGAAGVERIIEAMRQAKVKPVYPEKPLIFLAQLGERAKKEALKLFEEFREKGIKVAELLGRDSLKAQLKRADNLGVKYTIIIGRKEAINRTVTLRTMKTGYQASVERDKIVSVIKKRL